MKKAKEILGIPVVAIAEGEKLGTVKDVIIDSEKGKVEYLIVKDVDWYLGAKLLPFEDIRGIGPEIMTTQERDNVKLFSYYKNASEFEEKAIKIIGTKIYTETGIYIGKVSEILINENNGLIYGCEMISEKNEIEEKFIVPSSSVVTFGKHVSIVKDNVEQTFEKDLSSENLKQKRSSDYLEESTKEKRMKQRQIREEKKIEQRPRREEKKTEQKQIREEKKIEQRPIKEERKMAQRPIKEIFEDEKTGDFKKELDSLELKKDYKKTEDEDRAGFEEKSEKELNQNAQNAEKQIESTLIEDDRKAKSKSDKEINTDLKQEQEQEQEQERELEIELAKPPKMENLFRKKQKEFLTGRICTKNIENDKGQVLIRKGDVINEDIFDKFVTSEQLTDLTMNSK